MIRQILPIALISSILILSGCAERNNPVTPDEPALVLISQTQTPGWANGLAVSGNIVFIADGEQGITIWDVSNLSNPVCIDNIRTVTDAKHVAYAELSKVVVVHEQGYVTAYKWTPDSTRWIVQIQEEGMSDIDIYESAVDDIAIGIADPNQVTGSFRIQLIRPDPDFPDDWWDDSVTESLTGESGPITGYTGLHMDIADSCVYLAHGQLGFDIAKVEINSGISFTLLGNSDTYGCARDIGLNGTKTHAVVADLAGGIQIFDVTDKNNPSPVGSLIPDGVGDAERVVVAGDTAYFIDRYDGLFAVDIRHPEEPVLITKYDLPAPNDIYVSENHIVYVVDQDIGLVILSWR